MWNACAGLQFVIILWLTRCDHSLTSKAILCCYCQLERLQAENAQEWAKRERLETEKLALERENKKLKKEVESLEEELEKKTQQASSLLESDLKTAHLELDEKNKVFYKYSNMIYNQNYPVTTVMLF